MSWCVQAPVTRQWLPGQSGLVVVTSIYGLLQSKWPPYGCHLHRPLVMGQGVCIHHTMHACMHQIYRRGMQHTPGLTFYLTLGQGTLCTTTLFARHSLRVLLNLSKLLLCRVILFTKLGHWPSDSPTARVALHIFKLMLFGLANVLTHPTSLVN